MGIVQDLRVLYTKRREVNLKDYADLVRQAADGDVSADDDLLDVIERTGKPVADFQADVETLLSRREAAQGLIDAEAMTKDVKTKADEYAKAGEDLRKLQDECEKRIAEARTKVGRASSVHSAAEQQQRLLLDQSLQLLERTVDPALLEEIATIEAELDHTRESLRSVNDLIMRAEMRDESEFDRYSDMRPHWKKQQERRDELQELVPQLEAKLEALEKQKLDPERMRWTEVE